MAISIFNIVKLCLLMSATFTSVEKAKEPKNEAKKEPKKETKDEGKTCGAVDVKTYIESMTAERRFECCLANCAPLMAHARTKYGQEGSKGMSTTSVRAWLKQNPQHVPEYLKNVAFHVDHIVPDSLNGSLNWPLNYMLVPSNVNQHFSGFYTREKEAFVGKHNVKIAKEFAKWVTLQSKTRVEYGKYDPVTIYED